MIRKLIVFVMAALILNSSDTVAQSKASDVLSKGTWIDLTYSFSDSTLYWPNNKTTFHKDTMFNGMTERGYFYSSYQFCAPEHGGTHLDAPIHFAANSQTADQIPLSKLAGDGIVIDVSANALPNRDYLISVADVLNWEKKNGTIPDNMIVFFSTGYGKFYPDAEKYFGTSQRGEDAVLLLHFPGLDAETASWLIKNRKVKAVGLDTPSIDYGQSKDFKSHRVLAEGNVPVFENVANLHLLPVKGAYIIALPMKISGGSGGPLRIIAWVQK